MERFFELENDEYKSYILSLSEFNLIRLHNGSIKVLSGEHYIKPEIPLEVTKKQFADALHKKNIANVNILPNNIMLNEEIRLMFNNLTNDELEDLFILAATM